MRSGPKCKVCRHSERWRIELLRAGGASLDSLAQKFDVSRDSIMRHWHNHVSPEAKARYLAGPTALADLAAKATSEGDSVLDHFRAVRVVLMGQLASMAEAGDARGTAIVAAQLIAVLDKIGKVTGEIAQLANNLTVNNIAIINSPEFARAQAAILRALAGHPAARVDVVAALQALDAEATGGAPGAFPVIEHLSHA